MDDAIPSVKDVITERIRRLIHINELVAGEHLSIETLASRFGVSRTPVRDALFQLSVEGLVTVKPRVGVFIREIGVAESLDVYHIRSVLEPVLASWAATRGSWEDRLAFYDSLDLLDDAAERDDVEEYVRLLELRRATLLDMADSPPLLMALEVIDGRTRLLRFRNLNQPGQLTRSAVQHRAVGTAVRDGDGATAYTAMREHVVDAERRARKIFNLDDEGIDYSSVTQSQVTEASL